MIGFSSLHWASAIVVYTQFIQVAHTHIRYAFPALKLSTRLISTIKRFAIILGIPQKYLRWLIYLEMIFLIIIDLWLLWELFRGYEII